MPALVGRQMDQTSDAIDEGGLRVQFVWPSTQFFSVIFLVNVMKGKTWNDESEFAAAKNKAQFRQYEDACDRVKFFYREQHGMSC